MATRAWDGDRRMLRGASRGGVRYGIAVLAVGVALVVKVLLNPLIQEGSSFLLLSAAVLVAAAYGGFGPGAFATLLSAVVGDYFFLSPVGTFVPPSVGHGLRTVLFLAQGLAISAIGARLASARRRAEGALESLRESEERYRLLVEGAEDYAIFMLTPDGRIRNWNKGAERLFGYGEAEVVGEDAALLFTPEDRHENAHKKELRRAETEGRAVDERWHLRKDGTRFWANGFVRPVRDEAGGLKGFSKVARDITERKKAEDAQRLLAEAGGTLSSSLDYRATLAGVARLAVPRLADWCAVDVLEGDGSLERLAVAHQDPGKVRLAYEIQERYPSDPEADQGVHHVLRTGEPEMVPEIPWELLDRAVQDDEHREIIRELGLRSYIVVPLIARGKTLGAISLVTAESGRVYGETDLELAQELAGRAALAVDNARLYEEAQTEIEERERAEEAMREIREAERNRMARELHDGVLQDLTYVAAAIEITKVKAEGTGLEGELEREMGDIRRAVGDLREAIYDLRAYSHQGQSARELLESLVELNRRRAPETTLEFSVDEDFFTGLSEREEMELLRVVQEALTNTRRHSGADNVRVDLRVRADELIAEVSDDGKGFDTEAPPGIGLRSIRERVRALGGRLEVESEPGRGTRVRARIPPAETTS